MHDKVIMAEVGMLYNSAFAQGGVLEKTGSRSVEGSQGNQKTQLQHSFSWQEHNLAILLIT